MAHIGKNYKLQFRRDLSLGVLNVDGWAEAYDVTTFTWAGSLGIHLNGVSFQLVNTLKNNQPPMVWTSAATIVAGRTYVMTYTITDLIDIQTSSGEALVELTDSSLGLVFRGRMTRNAKPYQNISGSGFFGQFFLTPQYRPAFATISIRGTFAPWSSYNP